jgi:hypothetical protein
MLADTRFIDNNKGTVFDIDLTIPNEDHRNTLLHGDGFEWNKWHH